MKLARPLAASGVAVAAVVATLGAVAPAQAAPVTTTYTCAVNATTNSTLTLTIDALLPPSATAGTPILAGQLGFKVSAKVATADFYPLAIQGANGIQVTDFAVAFGSTSVPTTSTFGAPGIGATEVTFSGTGGNAAFVLPAAGNYDVKLPAKFTVQPTQDGKPGSFQPIPCTTTAPVKLTTIPLSKQITSVTAKAPKKAVKAAKAKLAVAVTNEFGGKGGPWATGKVVAKEGKKVVGTASLVNGKSVLKLKKLKHGTHKIKVAFAGDAYSQAAAAKVVKVKVK